jgi:hypothetical protein
MIGTLDSMLNYINQTLLSYTWAQLDNRTVSNGDLSLAPNLFFNILNNLARVSLSGEIPDRNILFY